MKLLILFLITAAPLCAQWIVNDPINTVINTAIETGDVAYHGATLEKWVADLEKLDQQIKQLQNQLAVQQRIRDVIGDPKAAGAGLLLTDLGASDLAKTYGETMAAVRRLSNAIDSLRRTSDGLYQSLDDKTALGKDFTRQGPLYLRFAAVERQADNLAAVQAATETRAAGLQSEIAATLELLKSAATQAETDKLTAKLAALNGQLLHVDAQRRDEADKLHAQQILNDNQAAKERQDFLEKQLAEENQTMAVIGTWEQGVQLTPTNYSR